MSCQPMPPRDSDPALLLVLVTMLTGLTMVGAVLTPPLAADAVSQPRLVHVPAAEGTDLELHRGTARTSELPAVQHVANPSSTWRSAWIWDVATPDATLKPPNRRGVTQLHQGRIDDKIDLRSELLIVAAAQRRVMLDWSPGHYAAPTLDPASMWRTRWALVP